MKYPEAGGLITDCLSGDVNRDFTQLWDAFGSSPLFQIQSPGAYLKIAQHKELHHRRQG